MKEHKVGWMSIFNSGRSSKKSLSRLAMFVSIIVGSYVVVLQAHNGTLNYDIYLVYMLAMTGANSINKGISAFKDVKQYESERRYSNYSRQNSSYTDDNYDEDEPEEENYPKFKKGKYDRNDY